jgi:hypothetical protein
MNLPAQLVLFDYDQASEKLLAKQKERFDAERTKLSDSDVPWLRKMSAGEYFQVKERGATPPLPVDHSLALFTALPESELNAVAIANSYIVVPTTGALHAFVMFLDSLSKQGRVQIGVLTIRHRARLCAVAAKDGVLYCHVLANARELSTISEFAQRHVGSHLFALMDEFDRHKASAYTAPQGRKRTSRRLRRVS